MSRSKGRRPSAGASGPHRAGTPKWILLTAVVLVAALWPLLGAGFLENWDDPYTIARNPDLNPPTLHSILRYWDWNRPYMDLYVPVTYTTWAIIAMATRRGTPDEAGISLRPACFHAANLLLHVVSAGMVLGILFLLIGARGTKGPRAERGSALGAMLFALHPLQVEAVGWASGLKDVLSGALALAAVYFYLRSAAAPPGAVDARRSFVLSTLLFPLAMLAKPSAVAALLVAGALDVMVLRRSWRRVVPRLFLWLGVAAPIVMVARIAQAGTSGFASPAWGRPLVALDALGFYLVKLALPLGLAIDYGRSPDWLLSSWQARATWLLPVAMALAIWLTRKRAFFAPAAGAVFVLGLLPTLGLAKFNFQYYSTVADHYVYLAMLGPALALGFFCAGREEGLVLAAAAALVAGFGFLSHLQSFHWRGSIPLFEHALVVNPSSVAANVNLGLVRLQAGAGAEAAEHFRAALRVRPDDAEARSDLGAALVSLDRYEEAIREQRAALALQRGNPVIHYNLGIALARVDRLDEALREYGEALRSRPDYAEAHVNLAGVLARLGNDEAAIDHYQAALRINPALEPARNGLAATLARRPDLRR